MQTARAAFEAFLTWAGEFEKGLSIVGGAVLAIAGFIAWLVTHWPKKPPQPENEADDGIVAGRDLSFGGVQGDVLAGGSTKNDHSIHHGGHGDVLAGGSSKVDNSTHYYYGDNRPQPEKIDPQKPTKSYNLGVSYEEQRDYTRAIQYYEKALTEQEAATGSMSKDLALVHNTLGIAYWRAARYTDAIEQYNGALAIYRENGEMGTNLRTVLSRGS
jgi:hypothetical protein